MHCTAFSAASASNRGLQSSAQFGDLLRVRSPCFGHVEQCPVELSERDLVHNVVLDQIDELDGIVQRVLVTEAVGEG